MVIVRLPRKRLIGLGLLTGMMVLLVVLVAASLAYAAFHLEYVEQPEIVAAPVAAYVAVDAWPMEVPPLPTPKPAPPVVAAPAPRPASAPSGDDFWRRLANCESPNGTSGRYIGYFQFSHDTARKVGIDGSESYEEQRAAAQSWASQVNPGTTAGWPHCWHVASR